MSSSSVYSNPLQSVRALECGCFTGHSTRLSNYRPICSVNFEHQTVISAVTRSNILGVMYSYSLLFTRIWQTSRNQYKCHEMILRFLISSNVIARSLTGICYKNKYKCRSLFKNCPCGSKTTIRVFITSRLKIISCYSLKN